MNWGILKSPYGFMSVDGRDYPNGHRVLKSRLLNVEGEHRVPDHWITAPARAAGEEGKDDENHRCRT